MARYRILYPISQFLGNLAMRFDIHWLYVAAGNLEEYADECAFNSRTHTL